MIVRGQAWPLIPLLLDSTSKSGYYETVATLFMNLFQAHRGTRKAQKRILVAFPGVVSERWSCNARLQCLQQSATRSFCGGDLQQRNRVSELRLANTREGEDLLALYCDISKATEGIRRRDQIKGQR